MRTVVAALLFPAFTAAAASAAPLNITSIVGSWEDGSPVAKVTALANLDDQGTDAIRWGGDAGDITSGSGYNFTPGADILDVTLGQAFALGTFAHINNVIAVGSAITSVNYDFGFSTNGVPVTVSDLFSFSHNETDNSEPCNPQSVSICDDVVTVTAANIDQVINVGGDSFFFNLLGFSTDGGVTIMSNFFSAEGSNNAAVLYATVTSQPISAIPEPATLLMFGAGLGAIAFRLRSRRRRS